jgi:hypothetical protein
MGFCSEKHIRALEPNTCYRLNFTTEFATEGFTGTVNNRRLMFRLAPFASAGDTYYIDDIQLEKVIT